ncbi:MAG TPA: hypothetical protein VMR95_03190 [Candidatus Binatia bacterium]|nr:hypothetical protein [Candidatus Binatia bacterium]
MKNISSISLARVQHEFLLTEWYKDHFRQFELDGFEPSKLDPDKSSDAKIIEKMLLSFRAPILSNLPVDTVWQIGELERNEFKNLLVIRERGWVLTFGNSRKVQDVAIAVSNGVQEQGGVNIPLIQDIKKSIGTHPFKERIILISTGEVGPYTIIEGNHRAVAYQQKSLEIGSEKYLPKEVILGTSTSMYKCPWLNQP